MEQFLGRMKLFYTGRPGKTVVGTGQLARITTEKMIFDLPTDSGRDLFPVLNGQVGDTSACIQTVGIFQRMGRAGLKASFAGPAM